MHTPAITIFRMLLLCLLVMGGACAQNIYSQPLGDGIALPPDVVQYMDNRDICDHLRGEIPDTTDKRHETETIKNINKYCLNADSKLAALKKKYAGKKAVQEALSGYEERIESTLIYDK